MSAKVDVGIRELEIALGILGQEFLQHSRSEGEKGEQWRGRERERGRKREREGEREGGREGGKEGGREGG